MTSAHSPSGPGAPMNPADTALPQLATLWNASAMLEVLRRELTCIDRHAPEIDRCRILRVRYRPAMRSIVLYELDTDIGRGSHEPVWVTAVTYADDRAAQQHARLSDELAGASARGFRPCAHVSSLRAILMVYPFDRQLPALPALVAGTEPEAREAIVRSLGLDASVAASHAEWQITTARYRPMQGATLRYRLNSAARRDVYVKAYRDAEGRRALATLKGLHAALEKEARPFDVVRPLAYCEGPRALIIDGAPGTPMTDMLTDATAAELVARRAARALIAFHASDIPCEGSWGPAEIEERVSQAAALVTIACPELTESVRRVGYALAEYPTGYEPRPAQLDPKPDHFFFEDDRITFIDLDTFAAADPVFDAAFMYARTAALSETAGVAAAMADAAAEAFREEYLSQAPAGSAARFAINHAYALLQLSLYAVRHQGEGWRELAAARVAAAVEACARAGRDSSCLPHRA